MSKLNENIKKFRAFRHITQADLAERLNKSKNVISNWERGDNSPDPDTIEKICQILKVTPNQLFGWEPMPEYEEYIRYMAHKEEQLSALENKSKKLQDEIKKMKEEMEKYVDTLQE